MSEEAVVAQKGPYQAEVTEGETYYWCACGRSQKQPFCDGSHKNSGFEPVAYQADKTGTVYLCGCKRTGDRPMCDGTHTSL